MARQGQLKLITTATILLAALLSCVLPGTNPEQLPTETSRLGYGNYVQVDATQYTTSTPRPTLTLTPTNEIVIIESSSTPERDIILLSNFFVYTILEGDNFALLARRFCGDERKYKWLLQVNEMEEGEILEIGREVIVSCTEEDK